MPDEQSDEVATVAQHTPPRLIAAAPDLLAACEEALAFMEMIGNPAPPHPWMQIRDAVAKATAPEPKT